MTRSSPPLFPALALLLSCTPSQSDPGDVVAVSSSSSDGPPVTPTTGGSVDPTTDDSTTDDSTTTSSTTLDLATTTDVDDSTTLVVTTDTTTDATTGAPLRCGDGVVDDDEQCDAGHNSNSDIGACTLACKNATCGDGLVWAGEESCDDGNNHGYYGGCRPDCSLAEHCGDGEKNGPEECDLGQSNGTSEHPIDGVPCSLGCYHEALLMFLGSTPFAAAMNGATGADKHCQQLAEAAGVAGSAKFMAWISDFYGGPAARFEPAVPGMPYALLSGLRIAKDRAALLAQGPEDGITMTETGETIYKAVVWTDTNTDGTKLLGDLDCENWTQASPLWKASVGRSGVPKQDLAAWKAWKASGEWTTFKTFPCDQKYRLYCVEQ